MPKIEVNEKLFFKMVGKTYDYDTLEKKMTSAKAELDEKPDMTQPEDQRVIKIELNDTNRPDLWSTNGVARQLYLYDGGKMTDYNPFLSRAGNIKDCGGRTVTVDPELKDIRPYMVAFIISGKIHCAPYSGLRTIDEQALINKEMCSKIINGNYDIETTDKVLNKFLIDLKTRHLIPSVIVDYKRVAYIYPISTVRITFDYNIKSGDYNYNLFDNDTTLTSVIDDNLVVLEVKFDEVLPLHIANVLETIPSFRQAVSKFALCREVK